MRVALIIALAFASSGLPAQEQSHVDAARALLASMNAGRALEEAQDLIGPYMEAVFDQSGMPEEARPDSQYFDRAMKIVKEEMSWEKMEPQLVAIYVEVFSEQELKDLTAFYSSPVGRKYVEKTPELTAASMRLTQQMMQKVMPRMRELEAEFAQDSGN